MHAQTTPQAQQAQHAETAETTEQTVTKGAGFPRQLATRLGALLATAALATSCLTPPPRAAAGEVEAASSSAGSVDSEPYDWRSVVIGGGGFVTGLLFSSVEAGILYARTDVGGAYRHDPEKGRWVPLTDFLGLADSGYMGIESFAAHPVDPNRVYMAVGMYTAEWAPNGAFMRSDDRGDTWKIFPVNFKMGGNDLSRSNGERLAVDPHKPNVLYFGSRRSGLQKSEDEAQTWKQVASFPVSGDAKGLGFPFVVFDPTSGKAGEATPVIYVGSQVDGKIYRSKDAGGTWSVVHEQPAAGFLPRRASIDKDGTLYVTYALGDSPYALSKGAVYKFDPKKEAWTDITPLQPTDEDTFGYGGISVDPSNPGTLVTSTMDRWTKGAEIFRSKDGGQTWKPTFATAVFDAPGVRHIYHNKEKLSGPQWMGDIKIDPFNPNRALIVEGGGVWMTEDLQATDEGKPVHWTFHSNNLEELVPRDLISPPEGAPLLSVNLDLCGLKHDDITVSPVGGPFQNPTCASADDIDFAGKKPNIMVRVGSYPWDGTKAPRGGISTDGGTSWKGFGAEPAGSDGRGSVALAADGSVIVWAPRSARPAFSRDGGNTWTPCEGLSEPTNTPDWAPWYLRLASDKVNPKKFYAFDALKGIILVSEDGGANFTATETSLRAVPEYELQYASLQAVLDHEGEVWATTKTELAHSSDSGQSFDTLSNVDEGHAVGFGKAAPGQDYPAIYITGTIGEVTGYFRSDDGGDNFVRINDDQHQYGGGTVITGDPRIYGRVYVAPGGRGIVVGDPKK